MATPEGRIENHLVKQAKAHDCWVRKFTSPSSSGVPDRVVAKSGITAFIELKAPGETPRLLQKKVIDDMRRHGMTVFVFDSKTQIDCFFDWISNKTTQYPIGIY